LTKKKSKSTQKKVDSAKKTQNNNPTKEMKVCNRKNTSKTCKNENNCAWDPRRNPKCQLKKTEVSLFDLYAHFESDKHKLKFTYPITKKGIETCMFASHQPDGTSKPKLYLRYSKALLETMKPAYKKALRAWWCDQGEDLATRREKRGENPGVSHRIGKPIMLTDSQAKELSEWNIEACNEEDTVDIDWVKDLDKDDDDTEDTEDSEKENNSEEEQENEESVTEEEEEQEEQEEEEEEKDLLPAPVRRGSRARKSPSTLRFRAENDLNTNKKTTKKSSGEKDKSKYSIEIM
jgi:hypothetical protein